MSLSADAQAWAMTIYRRNCLWQKYQIPGFGWIGFMPFPFLAHDLVRDLQSPDAGQHIVSFCLIALFLGALVGAMIIQFILLPKLRRRDQEIIAFLENHFPEECPWKQEEALLRQADELQRKAKIAVMPSVVGHP